MRPLSPANRKQLAFVAAFFAVLLFSFSWIAVSGGFDLKLKESRFTRQRPRAISKRELAQGVSVDERDTNNGTPMWHALWNNRFGVADLLVARGANLRARNNAGQSVYDTFADDPVVMQWLRRQEGR